MDTAENTWMFFIETAFTKMPTAQRTTQYHGQHFRATEQGPHGTQAARPALHVGGTSHEGCDETDM